LGHATSVRVLTSRSSNFSSYQRALVSSATVYMCMFCRYAGSSSVSKTVPSEGHTGICSLHDYLVPWLQGHMVVRCRSLYAPDASKHSELQRSTCSAAPEAEAHPSVGHIGARSACLPDVGSPPQGCSCEILISCIEGRNKASRRRAISHL
jgi:hypothetical protein